MKSVYIFVSGLVIELSCRHYEYIKHLCNAFLLYGLPSHIDIQLEVSDEDLNDRNEMPGGFIEPECNREFYKLHRLLRLKLLDYNRVIIHGAALSVNGEGILFTASSGVGKSVQADLWKDVLSNQVSIINDDWPILRIIDESVFISSSPWCGHRNIFSQLEVPLKGVFFIERSSTPWTEGVDESFIITELIKRTAMLYADISKNTQLYIVLERIVRLGSFHKAGITLNKESVISVLSCLD